VSDGSIASQVEDWIVTQIRAITYGEPPVLLFEPDDVQPWGGSNQRISKDVGEEFKAHVRKRTARVMFTGDTAQPLEDGEVTIARAHATIKFPALFMLIAAMNPCPCGYQTDPRRACTCSPIQIERYLARISGPLIDRIDIHVEVSPDVISAIAPLIGGGSSMESRANAARAAGILRAREIGRAHV